MTTTIELAGDPSTHDDQTTCVAGTTPAERHCADDTPSTRAPSTNQPGQRVHDTQRDPAGPTPPANEPPTPEPDVPAGLDHPPTNAGSTPEDSASAGHHIPPTMVRATPVVVTSAGAPAAIPGSHTIQQPPLGPILADPVLGLFADILDDLESVRIANANRLRQLTDTSEHGHGLSLHSPEVKRLASLVATLEASEHQAVLSLQRAMRAHPLGAWVKQTRGVGEKQAARLLATIRDPYWNDLHDRPRLVSELWAYCGLHVVHPGGQEATASHVDGAAGVAPTRRRGQKANWNNQARQRVWLIAASCIKVADSPYRDVYDTERAKYADAIHAVSCPRCGPAGSPAQPGTPLSAGHQHGRAMRRMCKEILRDLWREAARIHTEREAV